MTTLGALPKPRACPNQARTSPVLMGQHEGGLRCKAYCGSNHDLLANLHRQLLAAAALRGRGWAARAPWGPGDILTGAPWRRAPPLVPWRLG